MDEDKKIYLTSSIFFYNDRMYFEKDDNECEVNDSKKYIMITSKNWLKYLDEYGWENIDIGWRMRLNIKKFSKYGKLECGAGGDCLFHCIGEALNEFYNPEKNKSSKKKLQTLRDLMAYSDGKNNIFEIALKINKSLAEVLEAYKILKQKKIIRGKFI